MKPWLAYCLVALVLWGLWGVFGKLAARSLPPSALLLLSYCGIVLVFPIVLILCVRGIRLPTLDVHSAYALLSGLIVGFGFLFFYLALGAGETSRVVLVTATYPVVTVLIAAAWLGEPITVKSALGIMLAVSGVLLLST